MGQSPDKQGHIDLEGLVHWFPNPEIPMTFGGPHKYIPRRTLRLPIQKLLLIVPPGEFHFLKGTR